MKIRDQIQMARRNLRRQKGRTRLTLLSIIIGAFAVIAVIILAVTANQAVEAYFEETGQLYSIQAERVGGDEQIDDALAADVGALEGVRSVSPMLRLYDFTAIRSGEQRVNIVGGVELTAELPNGTTDQVLVAGRNLADSDTGALALVSADIAGDLTGGQPDSLVGSTILLESSVSYRGPGQSPENCDFGDGMEEVVCSAVDVPVEVVGIVQGSLSVFFPLEFGVSLRETTYYAIDDRCNPESEFWTFSSETFDPPAECEGLVRADTFSIVDDFGYEGLKIRVDSDEAISGVTRARVNDFGMRNRLDTQGEGSLEFAVGREELEEIQNLASLVTLIFLIAALAIIVGLSRVLSPSLERVVVGAGLPLSFVAVAIALVILLPEGVAAFRFARQGHLQSSFNIGYGSALASIGLTIPALVVVSFLLEFDLEFGLRTIDIVMFLLTLVVSTVTVASHRVTLFQGGLHLAIFAAFLFLAISP